MPQSDVDYRSCLKAVGAFFGKEPAFNEALPEGVIDLSTFLYIVDKCGLVAAKESSPPPFEMAIPFLVIPTEGQPYFVSFPRDGEATLTDQNGAKVVPIEELAPLSHANIHHHHDRLTFYVLSQRTEGKLEMSFLSKHAWFWDPIFENSWDYMQVALGTLMGNFLSISLSVFMMVVYDRVVPNKSYDSLTALTIGVIMAMVLEFVIRQIRSHFVERAGQRVDLAIGRHLFDRMFEIRIEGLRGGVGAAANVFKEAESIRDFFTSASLIAFIDVPFLFLYVGVIYWFGGALAWIPVFVVVIVALYGLAIQPMMEQKAAESFSKGRTKHGVVVETLGGLETLRAIGGANFMRRRWMEGSNQQSVSERESRTLAGSAISITALLQQVAQVAALVFGVMMMDDQTITMGGLVATVMLTARAVAPMAQLAQMLVRLNQARTAFASVDRIMRAPGARDQTRRYTRRPRFDGKIEFRNVSYAYPEQEGAAISNLSFAIAPGEKVAVLGRVGSGKSTLAKLVLGLYQPTAGTILFDGIDSRQLEPTDIQANMSAMLQDNWLFSGTVRENIALGKMDATEEEIHAAAVMSTTHDFISQQSIGYDLQVGERGASLSGGQRQTVAMARTLIRSARILLLDEPTSAMDTASEAAMIARMRPAIADKTLLLVTHRTSLLDLVDRVIILERGQIVRDAPKAEILAQQPVAQ